MPPKKYQIKHLLYLVKDEKSVRFHLAQDDYFGTIATILSLVRQKIEESPKKQSQEFSLTLKNLENDLVWLQENFQITPKIKKRNKTPKGREKNQ
jgi:hypothetical protein